MMPGSNMHRARACASLQSVCAENPIEILCTKANRVSRTVRCCAVKEKESCAKNTRHHEITHTHTHVECTPGGMNSKMKICYIDDKKKLVYFILHSSTLTLLLLFWLYIISFLLEWWRARLYAVYRSRCTDDWTDWKTHFSGSMSERPE